MGHYIDQQDIYYEGDKINWQDQEVPKRPSPNHTWNGSTWVAAPPPVPAVVTMRQARLALLGAGLLTQVNDAVAGLPGAQGDAARITWEFSSEVRRDDALVSSLAAVLNLSSAQLDQLFTTAGGL